MPESQIDRFLPIVKTYLTDSTEWIRNVDLENSRDISGFDQLAFTCLRPKAL